MKKLIASFFFILTAFIFVGVSSADSTWTQYHMGNSPLPTNYISSIDFIGAGMQFVGTSGGGLVEIADSGWTILNQNNTGVPIDYVRSAAIDPSGNLYLAAASGNLDMSPIGFGVASQNSIDSAWAMVNRGLEINQVITGIIIADDVRYVSTYGGGLTIYDNIGWIRYRYLTRTEFTYADSQQQIFDVPPGTYLPSDYVRAITIDRSDNTIWIATATGGAVRLQKSNWRTFKSSNSGLPSNQLLSIKVNPHTRDIFFGTAGFGIARLTPDSVWSLYNSGNSPLPNGFIHSIEIRPDSNETWFGTGYGVWVLDQNNLWRGYIPPNNDFIWGDFYSDIAFDSSGSVWVSAYGGGMASLNLATPPPPPPPPPAESLLVDIERLYIFFFNNRPVERTLAQININEAPELAGDDTVSLDFSTTSGSLYGINLTFGEFHRSLFHNGGRTTFHYIHSRLLVFLRIRNSDHSDIQATIFDLDADMNREFFENTVKVTMRLGQRIGYQIVNLDQINQEDCPELNFEYEHHTARAYGIGESGFITDNGFSSSYPLTRIETGNFPNPFNAQTRIGFNLPGSADVVIEIYDVLGRNIDRLQLGYLSAGEHAIVWPEYSRLTNEIPSGIYYYRLLVDNVAAASDKMTLLK